MIQYVHPSSNRGAKSMRCSDAANGDLSTLSQNAYQSAKSMHVEGTGTKSMHHAKSIRMSAAAKDSTADADGQISTAQHESSTHVSAGNTEHHNANPSELAYREVIAGMPSRSLFLLSKRNPIRKAAMLTISNKYFDWFILAMIILNCITLAMYSHRPGFNQTPLGSVLAVTEYYFLAVFSVEMMLKMIALGLILAPGTYLRDGWNILDAVVVGLGCLDVAMTGSSYSALRAVRVLRPLRTITRVKGLRMPVVTLLKALPMLSNVGVLILFVLFMFGIVAVQLFAGVLNNRCAAPDFSTVHLPSSSSNSTAVYQNVRYVLPVDAPNQHCSGYMVSDITWIQAEGSSSSVPNSSSNSSSTPVLSGGTPGGGYVCPTDATLAAPYGLVCAPFQNPNNGMTSFDNVLWAWITIFQCITQEGWTDVLYAMQDALSPWVTIYFVLLIVFGSFFLVNLALAVLFLQFTKEYSVVPVISGSSHRVMGSSGMDSQTRDTSEQQLQFSEAGHRSEVANMQGKRPTVDDYDESFAGTATTPKTAKHLACVTGNGQLMGATGSHSEGLSNQAAFVSTRNEVWGPEEGYAVAEVRISRPPVQLTNDDANHCSKQGVLADREQLGEPYSHMQGRSSPCKAAPAKGQGQQQQRQQQGQGPSWLSAAVCSCAATWSAVQQACRRIINASWFWFLNITIILANTGVMAASSYPMDLTWSHVSDILNVSFSLYFGVELVLKVIGLGPRQYIRDRMNQFDVLVVLASLVEVMTFLAPGEQAGTNSLSVLRTTRLLRVFKLARSWQELNRIIIAVLRSFSQVMYLSLLLLLFMFVFALMGMQLFGYQLVSCDISGSQQLCPPGMRAADCPDYPDCYLPCSGSQVFTWFSVPGSPYNDQAYCEQFPRNSSYWGNAAAAQAAATAAPSGTFQYWAQVGKADVPDSCFDNIGWALVTVFQLITTENWNNVMYTAMSATSPAAALWFIAVIIIGHYMLLNLFLAVLLENFGSPSGDKSGGTSSKGASSNNALAAAADAALLLDWMKELLASSWIAKLVGRKNKIHALPQNSTSRSNSNGSAMTPSSELMTPKGWHETARGAGSAVPTIAFGNGASGAFGAETQQAAGAASNKSPMPGPRGLISVADKEKSYTQPLQSPRRSFAAEAEPKSRHAAVSAVTLSALSTPRLQAPPGMGGFVVEASAQSYSAGLLQGNVDMLIYGETASSTNTSGGNCDLPHGTSSIAEHGQDSMNCHSMQHLGTGPAAARASMFGGEAGPGGKTVLYGHNTSSVKDSMKEGSEYWDQPQDPLAGNMSMAQPLAGCSCFLLSPENWLRKQLAWLISHRHFDNAVLVLICLSSLALALEMPSQQPDSMFRKALEILDMVFAVLFALEALLKILVKGFMLNGQDSYLQNPWNVLDFAIVLIGILLMAMSLAGSSTRSLGGLRALRTLRAVRPLRVASRMEGMKVVVNSLFASLPPLGNVLLVCLLFYLIFGIMGVDLLAGMMYSCRDSQGNLYDADYVLPPGQYITRDWCENKNLTVTSSNYHAGINVSLPAYTPDRAWVNPVVNFDNILLAILTLFQISTTELWVNTMYDCIRAVGIDQQPRSGNNPALSVYFIVFMIIGNFFVLQLFVSVTIEKFSEMQRQGRNLLLTPQQEEWVNIERMMADIKLQVRQVPPMQSRWRIAAFKMIMSYQFEMLIIVAIILNLLIMALTHADMNSHWQNFMSYANLAFTVAFTAEAGAKCVVLGVRAYLRDAWCRFDLFVVAVSIAGVAVDLGTPSNLAFLPLLRVLRVTRIFRLIPKAEGIKNLLQTLVLSLPALGNVGSVLLLFFFIYGVIGMNLFGQMKYGVYLDRHANFSNVGIALLTLFRIITGESWDGIMQDCMVTSDCIQVLQDVSVQDPASGAFHVSAGSYLDPGNSLLSQVPAELLVNRCSPSPLAAVAYFCSFVLLCGLVLVNFVIGVIIDNMQSSVDAQQSSISRAHVEHFVKVWSELDPYATHYIPAIELSTLIQELEPPMGVKGEAGERAKVQSIIMALDIPVRKIKIHFLETLHALAGRVAGTELPDSEERKLHQRIAAHLPANDPAGAPKYTVAHFYAALYVQAAVRGFLRRHALLENGAVSNVYRPKPVLAQVVEESQPSRDWSPKGRAAIMLQLAKQHAQPAWGIDHAEHGHSRLATSQHDEQQQQQQIQAMAASPRFDSLCLSPQACQQAVATESWPDLADSHTPCNDRTTPRFGSQSEMSGSGSGTGSSGDGMLLTPRTHRSRSSVTESGAAAYVSDDDSPNHQHQQQQQQQPHQQPLQPHQYAGNTSTIDQPLSPGSGAVDGGAEADQQQQQLQKQQQQQQQHVRRKPGLS